jgi:tetratricopeptide (TPR) repeat protein
MVQDLTRGEVNYDQERGESLLNALRKDPSAWIPSELEEPDTTAKEIFERAISLFNQGDHSSAEREFRKAIELEPSYIGVLHNSVVRGFENAEDWQRAINAMRFVIWVAPDYKIARNNLAVAYLNYGVQLASEGEFERAIELYSTALGVEANSDIVSQIKKNIASSFTSLGIRGYETGKLEQSWKHMLRACNFDAGEHTRRNLGLAYTLYAISLVESKQFADAVYYFESAADTGFVNAVMLNDYGVALASLGLLNEAIRRFERALEFLPGDGMIQQNLSLARSQQESPGSEVPVEFHTEGMRPEYYSEPLQTQEYKSARLPIKSPEYLVPA